MNENKYPTCEDRIDAELASTIENLTALYEAWLEGDEDGVEDLGTLYEYGLCFDYVEPETFREQPVGYWRYQLSWGGPSDEFRFYDHGRDGIYVEYWFLDWFDGAKRVLRGTDRELLLGIYDVFHPG